MPTLTKYNPAIAEKICHEMCSGRALKQVCEDEGMPHFGTVFRWLKKHDDFREDYEDARAILVEYKLGKISKLGEQAREIVENCEDPKMANAMVQALRVEIDTLKWEVVKLMPQKYGEKLQLAGDAENPLTIKRVVTDFMNPQTIEDVKLSDLVQPTPKQRVCIQATDKFRFVLYGGAAGGGKSYLLRWWCLRQLLHRFAQTQMPGLMCGLFSVDYPTLQDRQISKIEREFPQWLGATKRTDKEGLCFFLKPEFGGGRIALRNLSDATSYKSAEFCDIAIEELTENKRDVFEDLVLFRLRTPGVDRPCFLAGTNPTGKGLQWIKALWVDRKFPPELQHLKDEFCYVPALLDDNPYLGPVYRQALEGLPEKKRRALLDGDWSIPEGQYFTNFEPSERRVKADTVAEIVKPWWNHWISQDWGFKHHTPIHWHAVGNVQPDQAQLLGRMWDKPKQCIFTYREQVVSLSDEGMSEAQLGGIVGARSAGKISRHILSSDAFGQKTSQKTPALMLAEATKPFGIPSPVAADMSPGSRVVGWRFMHGLIQDDRWFISDCCPEAIDAIPALEYDSEKGGEDILKTDHLYDDIGDELRYGLQDMLNSARKPHDVELAEKIESTKDPFQQHFLRLAETERRTKAAQSGRNYWD